FGPAAQQLARRLPDERRRLLVAELGRRLGPRMGDPLLVAEQDWAADEWTRGGYMTHYAPTVLSRFGSLLRQPEGRIHWAGTDTATTSSGSIDGAVRSGQRAADEIAAAVA